MNVKGAVLSPCRRYRYVLTREWAAATGYAMFIGLNPSTADETQDDPTIRRCVAFAKAWGYSGLCMANLFAFRATDPKDMKATADPVGPDNDLWLKQSAAGAGIVVAAWGANGAYKGRDAEVLAMIDPLHCLKLTKDGCPGHPLYLPAASTPTPYPPA